MDFEMIGWAKVLPHPTTLILPSKCQSRGGLIRRKISDANILTKSAESLKIAG